MPAWLDVYRTLSPEPPPPDLAEQAALAKLCGAADADCFQQPGLYWLNLGFGVAKTLLAVTEGARWVWPEVSETSDTELNLEIHPLPDGLAHAALSFEWQERVPFCGDDSDAEENEREGNCTNAASIVSTEYRNWVVDLAAHRVLWTARCSVPGAGGAIHPVTVEGSTFTWQGCDQAPVPVHFDLARLKACPLPDLDAETTEWANDDGESTAAARAATEPSGTTPSRTTPSRGAELTRARKRIKAKDLAGALSLFDSLVAGNASDLPLLAERGFVRLLSGDLAGAENDLSRCSNEVPETDRALRAQVFFNLGLLAEKRKDPANARRHFERSHGYKPTKATRMRLALPAP